MIRIKPKDGLQIYDPAHDDFLPAEGRDVPNLTPYWHRRVREGGIEVAKAEVQAEVPKAEAAAKPVRKNRKLKKEL